MDSITHRLEATGKRQAASDVGGSETTLRSLTHVTAGIKAAPANCSQKRITSADRPHHPLPAQRP